MVLRQIRRVPYLTSEQIRPHGILQARKLYKTRFKAFQVPRTEVKISKAKKLPGLRPTGFQLRRIPDGKVISGSLFTSFSLFVGRAVTKGLLDYVGSMGGGGLAEPRWSPRVTNIYKKNIYCQYVSHGFKRPMET